MFNREQVEKTPDLKLPKIDRKEARSILESVVNFPESSITEETDFAKIGGIDYRLVRQAFRIAATEVI